MLNALLAVPNTLPEQALVTPNVIPFSHRILRHIDGTLCVAGSWLLHRRSLTNTQWVREPSLAPVGGFWGEYTQWENRTPVVPLTGK